MTKSNIGIVATSIEAPGPGRPGGVSGVDGRALGKGEPAAIPGLTGHAGSRSAAFVLGRASMISDKLDSIEHERRRRVLLASFLLATDVSVAYVAGLLVHHLFLIH